MENNKKYTKGKKQGDKQGSSALIRLNKFISNSGLCSRRKADELIANEQVKVNGKICTEMGKKVSRSDKVEVDGRVIKSEQKVYILMNKPRNVICTTKDENNRKTVIDILSDEYKHLYPVGRLDRNTTGVLLITNDGELTQKLIHPSKKIKKVYKATLDKPLHKDDLDKLIKGIKLEDGVSNFDRIVELKEDEKPRYGIELHSGKNRIIRRMIESLGCEVIKLDRVLFHNLDKGAVKKGNYRLLKEKELRSLGIQTKPKTRRRN